MAELRADILNGQDVVVFAPRRYGKSSLVWRVAQRLARDRVLVAQVDLMTTPTKEKLAEKLAKAIHDDIATPLFRAKERLRVFSGLRIAPVVTVDARDRHSVKASLVRLVEHAIGRRRGSSAGAG